MTYKIIFSDYASKQIRKLSRETQERVLEVLGRIRVRPGHFVIKLVGRPGYRLRVGDYRVILDLDEKNGIISVIELGHRKSLYK